MKIWDLREILAFTRGLSSSSSEVQNEGWEPEGRKWHFWSNGDRLYIYRMKALNELFLLAKVLSSMSVQIFIINNGNQYTKSDQTFPVKLVKCHLRVWFSTLEKTPCWNKRAVQTLLLTVTTRCQSCHTGFHNWIVAAVLRSHRVKNPTPPQKHKLSWFITKINHG